MFIDVCFPKNNEKEFLEIADTLKTEKLCYLYQKEKKGVWKSRLSTNKKTPLFFTKELSRKLIKKKNVHFFLEEGRSTKSFHYPTKTNQVFIKELKEHSKIVGVSFQGLLKKNVGFVEKTKFIVKLCNKYSVPVFLASFARNPYELRSRHELSAIGKLLGFNTEKLKLAFGVLDIITR